MQMNGTIRLFRPDSWFNSFRLAVFGPTELIGDVDDIRLVDLFVWNEAFKLKPHYSLTHRGPGLWELDLLEPNSERLIRMLAVHLACAFGLDMGHDIDRRSGSCN